MHESRTWRNDKYRKQILSVLASHRVVYFFDTETSGLSDKNDRIIEIAVIKCVLGEDNFPKELDRLHLYIRPPFALDPLITELTGITDEQLEECQYEEDCFNEIEAFFAADTPLVVAGHNVNFDTRFLKALYSRNGRPFPSDYIEIDTCQMARDVFTKSEVENYKLGTLVRYCGFDDGISFHSAIEDIRATVKLFYVLLLEYLNREYEETQNQSTKLQPLIRAINYWEGYRGYSRIYVETAFGSVYFDVRRKSWASKDANIDALDMDYIEQACWRATGSLSADEFSRYTGRIKLIVT